MIIGTSSHNGLLLIPAFGSVKMGQMNVFFRPMHFIVQKHYNLPPRIYLYTRDSHKAHIQGGGDPLHLV